MNIEDMSLEELLDSFARNNIRLIQGSFDVDSIEKDKTEILSHFTDLTEKVQELERTLDHDHSVKVVLELGEKIADLQKQVETLTTCRDHWKTSYEDIRKTILTPNENCPNCMGRGFTIFYDHKNYPVPHDEEHYFLCECVKDKVLKFVKELTTTGNRML
jgi:uncharacterized protein YoxC